MILRTFVQGPSTYNLSLILPTTVQDPATYDLSVIFADNRARPCYVHFITGFADNRSRPCYPRFINDFADNCAGPATDDLPAIVQMTRKETIASSVQTIVALHRSSRHAAMITAHRTSYRHLRHSSRTGSSSTACKSRAHEATLMAWRT